jgi:hypothetical protein
MVENIKVFYNQIKPAPLPHRKVFERANVEVDEA